MSEETGLVDVGYSGAEEEEPFKVALVWKVVTESDPSRRVPIAMVRGAGREVVGAEGGADGGVGSEAGAFSERSWVKSKCMSSSHFSISLR